MLTGLHPARNPTMPPRNHLITTLSTLAIAAMLAAAGPAAADGQSGRADSTGSATAEKGRKF